MLRLISETSETPCNRRRVRFILHYSVSLLEGGWPNTHSVQAALGGKRLSDNAMCKMLIYFL